MIYHLMDKDVVFFFIVIPLLSTIVLYFGSKAVYKHQWKAIHFSTQWTAPFYVFAVILLLEKWLKYKITGIVLIILISILALILIVQWKKKTEVILRNGLKVLTRICFLVFGFLYVLLLSYQMFQMLYANYLN